jgi:peptidoglycan hydrolase-like protein with peptidoglycan-binding domain
MTHYNPSLPSLNIAPPNTAPPRAGSTGLPASTNWPELRLGSKGKAVKEMQNALKSLGYELGSADGIFGPKTQAAVKQFQKDNQLKPDGIVGKMTQKYLKHGGAPLPVVKPAPDALIISPQAPGLDLPPLWSLEPSAPSNGGIPDPSVGTKGKKARVVVDISSNELFLFGKDGKYLKSFKTSDGGVDTPTQPGIKVLNSKAEYSNNAPRPLTTDGYVGSALFDLNDYDPDTNRSYKSPNYQQDLQGTFQDNLIGQDITMGNVRLSNKDATELFKHLEVGDVVDFRG